jgi:hypothetical protein
MATVNRQICCNRQIFATGQTEKRAVVAHAEAQASPGHPLRAGANPAEQRQFAIGLVSFGRHCLENRAKVASDLTAVKPVRPQPSPLHCGSLGRENLFQPGLRKIDQGV